MSTLFSELYQNIADSTFELAKEIKLFICDVDGVFSDGRIYLGNNQEEFKAFHTRDGYGVKALINSGVPVAIITGRQSTIVEQRMTSLNIADIYQGQENKTTAFEQLLSKYNLSPKQAAYIGDDLGDWPVLSNVGLSICVKDAHPWLRKHCHYTTQLPGGFGAVREVCDLLQIAQGTFNQTLQSST